MRIPSRSILLSIAMGCPLALGAMLIQPSSMPPSPTPQQPESYMAFVESLINAGPTEPQTKLAIETAVLGAAVAHEQSLDTLAASLLIAAAQIANPTDRRLFWDASAMLDPAIMDVWKDERNPRDPAINATTNLLQSARNGIPLDSDALHSTDIRAAIDSAARAAGYSGAEILRLLEAIAQTNGSDPCRGKIFNPERNPETRQIERVLCPAHRRPQCAMDSDEQFLTLLRIELAMSNIHTSIWSSTTPGSGGMPLRDPTIESLLSRFSLSIDRPYLRDGRWSESPE